ncbi:MAG: pectin esterase [Sphingobacteriaceae bacterium]|nr:pectin esterase [Sphingobacteriaceae bacterium]
MRRIGFIFFSLFLFLTTGAKSQVNPVLITVAKDGSGDYRTIQEAVNAVRDLSQKSAKIFIKKGVYQEKLVIPSWKTNINLIGEDKYSTIITGNDFSGKAYTGRIDPFGKDLYSTYTSHTVLVQGNDFRAENLTIQNTAGRVGQAVALHVEADRAVILNCRILGNQDTLYTATGNSRQYYKDCLIEGTTDFIFGEATVVFQNCVIKSLSNSYITAAATTPVQEYGYVFFDCKLIADTAAKKVYLGRPWRPYAKTVFIRTDMGNHILPQGWDPWKGDKMFPDKEKTTLYAEYGSLGPGAATTSRIEWSKQVPKRAIRKYTLKNIFGGPNAWTPIN